MDYKIDLSDRIKISDYVQLSVFKKAKIYYKKRPWILVLQIVIVIGGAFIHPVISIVIGLIAIFLPSWKEKKIE